MMNEIHSDTPLFSRRKLKKKCQVRFWTETETYTEFKEACQQQDLFMQDVFSDLMLWFVESSKNGTLRIKNNL